ncbi:predicted protein [Nematostella vectensis]|uniref:Uncharacterized protein n=1 Tax=Nematostella vectensis TaxID=45351 RepID=A7T432_NEMVE|nr:predicted protein [Nematostella vectensis]|eukprot:XP_001621382.1 hypothetical protein NEMVEDRAFT_v1g222047 [Nematostella vectensis]
MPPIGASMEEFQNCDTDVEHILNRIKMLEREANACLAARASTRRRQDLSRHRRVISGASRLEPLHCEAPDRRAENGEESDGCNEGQAGENTEWNNSFHLRADSDEKRFFKSNDEEGRGEEKDSQNRRATILALYNWQMGHLDQEPPGGEKWRNALQHFSRHVDHNPHGGGGEPRVGVEWGNGSQHPTRHVDQDTLGGGDEPSGEVEWGARPQHPSRLGLDIPGWQEGTQEPTEGRYSEVTIEGRGSEFTTEGRGSELTTEGRHSELSTEDIDERYRQWRSRTGHLRTYKGR